ncbi:hypothetical protein CAP35_01870 [Chitinophagaceae bacterium IBVUCB1]|nr:hypothetical protein CAP35_01870 [Chitinophagaceae bacterium IBVUCB1]
MKKLFVVGMLLALCMPLALLPAAKVFGFSTQHATNNNKLSFQSTESNHFSFCIGIIDTEDYEQDDKEDEYLHPSVGVIHSFIKHYPQYPIHQAPAYLYKFHCLQASPILLRVLRI